MPMREILIHTKYAIIHHALPPRTARSRNRRRGFTINFYDMGWYGVRGQQTKPSWSVLEYHNGSVKLNDHTMDVYKMYGGVLI